MDDFSASLQVLECQAVQVVVEYDAKGDDGKTICSTAMGTDNKITVPEVPGGGQEDLSLHR